MKKVLFIDRDGTLVREPEDEQIDSLEKLEFVTGVFTWLGMIARSMPYDLVMVSNQDGLGTDSFPEDTFWPAHNKMVSTLENEGIKFTETLIDRSFPEDNKPTRKPGIAMMDRYMDGSFDLENSYVIGDRLTDVELAKNLGCKAILLNDAKSVRQKATALYPDKTFTAISWKEIFLHLKAEARAVAVHRKTGETDVRIYFNPDGNGTCEIDTGLRFFDHMLEQIAGHGSTDLRIKVKGDLDIDEHHTIEDTGIALGEAILKSLGNKKGIQRYGFCLPMDDSLARVAIDFGGRPWLVWEADFKREKVGDVPTEMFSHFFKSVADNAKCNLNIKVEGDNEHHKIEAIFKAFARALKMAVEKDYEKEELPSTKGTL